MHWSKHQVQLHREALLAEYGHVRPLLAEAAWQELVRARVYRAVIGLDQDTISIRRMEELYLLLSTSGGPRDTAEP